MLRSFAIATSLVLTVTAAQAADAGLTARVHKAAVEACAVEASNSLPASHYAAITRHCVDRISVAALANIEASARAKTLSSTAELAR